MPEFNVGASKPKLSSVSLASACSTGIVNGVVEGVVNGVVNGVMNGVVNGAGAVTRFDAADDAVSLALVVASSAHWTRRLLRCRGLMPVVAFIRFSRMVKMFVVSSCLPCPPSSNGLLAFRHASYPSALLVALVAGLMLLLRRHI